MHRSTGMDRKFLDDWIRQQLRRQLCNPLRAGRLAEFDLEPLALPDPGYLAEPETPAGARDRLPLRVVDLRLQHHVDDESRHTGTVREHGCWLRLGLVRNCAVALQQAAMTRFVMCVTCCLTRPGGPLGMTGWAYRSAGGPAGSGLP